MRSDPEGTWTDLIEGKKIAEDRCKAFIIAYISCSVKKRVVLGPKEYEEVKTIRSGSTLQDIWAALVKSADTKVMKPKRLENPRDAGFWSLNFNSQSKGSTETAPYRIGQVRSVACKV